MSLSVIKNRNYIPFIVTLKQNVAAHLKLNTQPHTFPSGICKLMSVVLTGQRKVGECANSDIYWNLWALGFLNYNKYFVHWVLLKTSQSLIVLFVLDDAKVAALIIIFILTIDQWLCNVKWCSNKFNSVSLISAELFRGFSCFSFNTLIRNITSDKNSTDCYQISRQNYQPAGVCSGAFKAQYFPLNWP